MGLVHVHLHMRDMLPSTEYGGKVPRVPVLDDPGTSPFILN